MTNKEKDGLFTIGAILFMLIWSLIVLRSGHSQTLKRRTTPPIYTPSCKDVLSSIKGDMLSTTDMEIMLNFQDRKLIKSLEDRSRFISETHTLIPSFDSCRSENIKQLNIVLAVWKYNLAIDLSGSN